MDDLAESELPGAESEQAWFPRWALAGYGLALGAAGAVTAYQTQLVPQVRAGGVSAFVLGGGCVFLAARRRSRGREFDDEDVLVVEFVEEPVHEIEVAEVAAECDEMPALLDEVEETEAFEGPDPEPRTAIPTQAVGEDSDDTERADAVRLERLEAELADERARVDRVTADLAALRRVVVEQRHSSSKS